MKLRRKLAAMLAFAVVTGSMTVGASAVSADDFTDMPDDWSRAALKHAVDNGLLGGAAGKINPQGLLTRAELATIVNRAFGAQAAGDLSGFTDVPASEWYYADMQKAVHMGTFQGSNGKLNPGSAISRQEALTVLARALRLSGGGDAALAKFTDAGEVASWAKDPVAALAAAGYVSGSNGKLNPAASITRAEFAQVMDNLLPTYLPEKFEGTADGNAMVRTAGTVLNKATVKGDLVIGDGVGDGDVTLRDTKVEGRLVVRGGGVHSIIITGSSSVESVVVSKVDGKVRVSAENGAALPTVTVDDGKDDVIIQGTVAKVEVSGENVPVLLQNATVTDVVVSGGSSTITVDKDSAVKNLTVNEAAKDTAVAVSGKVTDMKTEATGTDVTVASTGKVETVAVADTASNSTVTADKGATVSKVETAASGTEVKGDGKVDKVEAQAGAEGTKVTTPSTNVTADKEAGAVDTGKNEVKPGETGKTEGNTPSGGGSSGGSSGPSYTVVTTEDELLAALKNSSYVRLGGNIELTKAEDTGIVKKGSTTVKEHGKNATKTYEYNTYAQIFIPQDKTLTLDLNGYTLTGKLSEDAYNKIPVSTASVDIKKGGEAEVQLLVNKGNLTIDGTDSGSEITTGYSSNPGTAQQRCLWNFEGTLTINGGTYTGWYAIDTNIDSQAVYPDIKNATTTINNATIVGGFAGIANFKNAKSYLNNTNVTADYYALTNNGTYGGTVFDVTGGSLTSKADTAVYFPAGDLLRLENVTVSAKGSGIEAFAGKVSLEGTTSVTNDYTCKDDNTLTNGTGDGSIMDGSAVLIGYRAGYKTTAASGVSLTVGDNVELNSKNGHCIRIFDRGTYSNANGASSITVKLPDVIPSTWSAASGKDKLHNQLTNAYTGDVTITGGVLSAVNDYVTSAKETLKAADITVKKDSDNAYQVSFSNKENINGTGAIAALAQIPGLTKVTVAKQGATDAVLNISDESSSAGTFKSNVLAMLPTSDDGIVDLTVTFTQGTNNTVITLKVAQVAPSKPTLDEPTSEQPEVSTNDVLANTETPADTASEIPPETPVAPVTE